MKKILNRIKNLSFHLIGAVILFLNQIRHGIEGYRTPEPFDHNDYEKAALYDISVVDRWEEYLSEYRGNKFSFKDLSILELGPGADLGNAFYLLAKEVSQYNSLDINPLINIAQNELSG